MEMTLRGVLREGGFRSENDLNKMTAEEKRNTLIVVLSQHSNQPGNYYQGFNNDDLIGCGAVLALLRNNKILDDATLKNMSDDQQRNTIISEIDKRTDQPVHQLQAKSNQELAQIGVRLEGDAKIVSAILDFEWHIDSAQVLKTVPEVIREQQFDNQDKSVSLEETFKFSEKVASKYSLSLKGEYKISATVEVSGSIGVPILAEGKAGIKIDPSLTLSAMLDMEQTTVQAYDHSSKVIVKPKTHIKMSGIVNRGTIDVPYRAKIRTGDGAIKWVEGEWKGTSTHNLYVKREPVEV